MFGNGKIFISHTHADNAACAFLLAALDAWGLDYWFDTQELSAGEQLSDSLQRALNERDIFVRVCTPSALTSFWMDRELAAIRGLRANDHRGPKSRLIVFLLLAPGYPQPGAGEADVAVNAAGRNAADWLRELRVALGVPAPAQAVSRRKLLAGGLAGGAIVVAGSAAGTLLFARGSQAKAQAVLPTTRAATPTPRPGDDRVKWFFAVGGAYLDSFGFAATPDVAVLTTSYGAYGLDAAKGAVLWHKTGLNYTAGLSTYLAGDIGYIMDGGGVLHALHLRDGAALWKSGGSPDNSNPFANTGSGLPPAMSDNVLYFAQGNAVRGYSLTDGSQVWGVKLNDGSNISTGLAVANGMLYFGADDGALFAVDIASQQLRWHFAVPGGITTAPVVMGGVVYQMNDDAQHVLTALDAATGAQRWQAPLGSMGFLHVSLAAADGTLYTYRSHTDGVGIDIAALDAATGNRQWQVTPKSDGQYSYEDYAGRPAVSADAVYATAQSQSSPGLVLVALARKDGSERWHYTVPGSSGSTDPQPPLSVGDTVYFVGADNALYALKA